MLFLSIVFVTHITEMQCGTVLQKLHLNHTETSLLHAGEIQVKEAATEAGKSVQGASLISAEAPTGERLPPDVCPCCYHIAVLVP